jgi:excisionase family DNA binding protein
MKFDKKYLTVKETAEYMGMAQQGIWKLCHEKRIRYYKPNGKRVFIALSDIEDYITGGEVFEPEKQFENDNKCS